MVATQSEKNSADVMQLYCVVEKSKFLLMVKSVFRLNTVYGRIPGMLQGKGKIFQQ